jgi:glycine cleavage system regulatory protein
MANTIIVITLLSNDQPGIVKQLAHVISEHKGNWLESRMAQLAGKFAGILKVSIDPNNTDQLTQALKQLSGSGIQILVESATELEVTPSRTLTFELVGADRIGIVNEISQAFLAKGINIDEMETHCTSMPWSGEPLFEATGVLSAPSDTNTDDLLTQLQAIEEKLGIDITLTTVL